MPINSSTTKIYIFGKSGCSISVATPLRLFNEWPIKTTSWIRSLKNVFPSPVFLNGIHIKLIIFLSTFVHNYNYCLVLDPLHFFLILYECIFYSTTGYTAIYMSVK